MDLRTYSEISRQLDFKKKPVYFVRHLAVDAMLFSAAAFLISSGNLGWFLIAQALLAVIFFRGFALMHDAVHQSVSDSVFVNELAGLLGGILCFMPFHSWKYLHLEHHQWAGNVDLDPSSKLRKDFDSKKAIKYQILTAVWKSWVPLLGLMQEIVFWIYPLQQIKNPKYSVGRKAKIVLSALVPLFVYLGAATIFPGFVTVKNFLPAGIIYLMMVELINFPHHMDVPAYRGRVRLPIMNQHEVSRSSYYPLWFSRLFLLNFNLHIEHHLFPLLPWYQLDRARNLIKAHLGSRYNESLGNAWIVKNRKRSLTELLPVADSDKLDISHEKAA